MFKPKMAPQTRKSLGKVLKASMAMALLLPAVAISPVTATQPAHAQASLLAMAAQHPNNTVSVIVQKRVHDGSVEAEVARLGGTVTRDLHIINAFSATMPASAVPQIATNVAVNWVSGDAHVVNTHGDEGGGGGGGCVPCVDTSHMVATYARSVHADTTWNHDPYRQGQGVGVAVVDTGVTGSHPDLLDASGNSRVIANVNTGPSTVITDTYGHGTHVAGLIAGNGTASNGAFIGVAPKANIINVKVSNDVGIANSSNVVAGL